MTGSLRGKVAVVTGAGSGIGWAITERLVREGAQVVAFGRDQRRLSELASGRPGAVHPVIGDVTREADLAGLAEFARTRFGGVDIVIPNAGICRVAPFEASDVGLVRELFDVNFIGAFQTVQCLLPLMRAGGSVVFVTTFLTRTAMPGLSVYSAAKSALSSLARNLALELAPSKIRVNAVAPGPIDTPIWGKIGLDKETLRAVAAKVGARLLAGNFGAAHDIAGIVAFLCSDDARNIYGQEVVADGGYMCC